MELDAILAAISRRGEVREETGIPPVSFYMSKQFDQFYSPDENYVYLRPRFFDFVDNHEEVSLNDEHSEYAWLTFRDAEERITLPETDKVIEKHFVQRKPSELLRVGNRFRLGVAVK